MEQTKNKENILIEAYDSYEESLLRRSFYKVSNRELANDLVQTTFLKTWEYMKKGGRIDSMKAFLFHVLNDLIIDEYRKKKAISLDVIAEKGFQIPIDDSDKINRIMDGEKAINLIPLLDMKYRKVITMRYLKDMSLKEIALATHQSNNTVAVQIHRGVEKLANLFRVEGTNILPI
jgi:RNA polymerase sigma-70 factor (ECF subfamily)